MTRNLIALVLMTVLLGPALMTVSGCDSSGPAERAGEKIDDAADDLGDAVDDACEDVKEAAGAEDDDC